MNDITASKPTISLIVPVFNNEPNLPETMPTYFEYMQSLSDYYFEIIFVEDGSKDGSWEMLEEFQARNQERVEPSS